MEMLVCCWHVLFFTHDNSFIDHLKTLRENIKIYKNIKILSSMKKLIVSQLVNREYA